MFLLLVLISSWMYCGESIDNVSPGSIRTQTSAIAQEHFYDLQKLLRNLKSDDESDPNTLERNRTVDRLNKFLTNQLNRNGYSFTKSAIPFLNEIIKKEMLTIPDEKKELFYNELSSIKAKLATQCTRRTTEEDSIKNTENSTVHS